MSRFIWVDSNSSRKLHLIDWETVSLPLDKGDLSISSLEDLNSALIIKWVFHFANDRNNL